MYAWAGLIRVGADGGVWVKERGDGGRVKEEGVRVGKGRGARQTRSG